MSYNIVMYAEADYWLEDSVSGVPFPAAFLSREAAEHCCILLNRDERQRIEASETPIHITLDLSPSLTPRQVNGFTQSKPSTRIKLDGYTPKDKELTVKVKEPKPDKPAEPKEPIKLVL